MTHSQRLAAAPPDIRAIVEQVNSDPSLGVVWTLVGNADGWWTVHIHPGGPGQLGHELDTLVKPVFPEAHINQPYYRDLRLRPVTPEERNEQASAD